MKNSGLLNRASMETYTYLHSSCNSEALTTTENITISTVKGALPMTTNTAQSVKETGADLLLRMIEEMKSIYVAEIEQAREECGTSMDDWFWQNIDHMGEKFYNVVETEIGWSNVDTNFK